MPRLPHLAAVLALLACNTGFEPQYRVTDLRILAVRADVNGGTTCDVMPGDVLELAALVANPRGSVVTVSWFACPPIVGERSPCLDPEFLRDPVGLAGTYPAGRVLFLGNDVAPPLLPVPDLGDALAAAIGLLKDPVYGDPTFACRLYVPIPVVVVAEGDGRREVATKDVRVVPTVEMLTANDIAWTPVPITAGDYVLNANPGILDVVSGPDDRDLCTAGTSVGGIASLPTGETVLCGKPGYYGQPGYDSAQDFIQCGAGTDRTWTKESLSWQWYTTGGTFPQVGGEGNAMGRSIDFERPPDAFTLWAILRDGRGGVAWTRRDVAAPQ